MQYTLHACSYIMYKLEKLSEFNFLLLMRYTSKTISQTYVTAMQISLDLSIHLYPVMLLSLKASFLFLGAKNLKKLASTITKHLIGSIHTCYLQ